MTFKNLEVTTVGSGDALFGIRVANSQNVNLTNLSVHGTMDGNPQNDISGVYITDSTNVSVTNSEFQQLQTGISQLRNTGLTISDNSFHDIQIDGIDGGGSNNVTIARNTFTNFYPAGQVGGSGDHADAIQFWTTNVTAVTHDITVTDNLFVRGSGSYIQGVFVNDESGAGYQNVTVTGNTIIGGEYNGVDVVGATNLTISNNTVGGFSDMLSWIRAENANGGIVSNNQGTNYVYATDTGLTQSGNATIATVTDGGVALLQAFIASHPNMLSALPANLAAMLGTSTPVPPITSPNSPTGLTLDSATDSGVKGDGITNIAQVTIDGTATAGSTVTLYDGTSLIGTGVANGAGAFSVQVGSALASGSHSITAKATDASGNASAASSALAVVVDTTAPTAPTALALDSSTDSGVLGDGITNIPQVKIDGTAAPGSTVTLYDGIALVGTGVANATTGAFSITVNSPLATGTHSIIAKATDAAGNVSASSGALAISVSSGGTPPPPTAPTSPTAPGAPTSLSLDASTDGGVLGDNLTNRAQVRIDGLAAAGSTVSLYEGTFLLGTGVANSAGAFSIATAAGFSAGAHSITAKATDASGNVSAASTALGIVVDLTNPNAPTGLKLDASTDSGTLGDGITNIPQVKIDGAAEAGSTVKLYDGTTLVGTGVANATTGAFSIQVSSALATGSHAFTATAMDAAGNLSAASAAYGLSVTSATAPSTPTGVAFTSVSETAVASSLSIRSATSSEIVNLGGTSNTDTTSMAVFRDGMKIATLTPSHSAWSFADTTSTAVHSYTLQGTNAAGAVTPGATTLIVGTVNSDVIVGTSGSDMIFGGAGADTVAGGAGADTFIYKSIADAPMPIGNQYETITDFAPGQDSLDLTGMGHMVFGGQSTSLTPGHVDWYVSGGSTFVFGDVNGDGKADFMIKLLGVHPLAATDFHLA